MRYPMKKGNEYTCVIDYVEFPNKGVAHIDGIKVTIKNTIQGQKVHVRINKARRNKVEARLLEVVERSPLEDMSLYDVYSHCGCLYQTLPYEEQLKMKEEQVKKLLAPFDVEEKYQGITGSPEVFAYRNKMEYSFGDEYMNGPMALGLHKTGSMHDIVTADKCKIVHEDFNTIVSATLDYFNKLEIPFYHKKRHEGYLRYFLIRRGLKRSEMQVNLVTSTQLNLDLKPYCDMLLSLDLDHEIKGIIHTMSDQLADAVKPDTVDILFGDDYFYEELFDLKFKITPFSFFQTNTLGAEKLYKVVRNYVGETKDKVIFDLYSGTGTITQLVAPVAKKAVGVEIVEEAVESAKMNAKLNGLDNCTFIAGDVLKVIDDLKTSQDKPDIIILDPPRNGIHPKALPKS